MDHILIALGAAYASGFWAGVGLVMDKYCQLSQALNIAQQEWNDIQQDIDNPPPGEVAAYLAMECELLEDLWDHERKRVLHNLAFYAGLSWFGVYAYLTTAPEQIEEEKSV